MVVKNLLSHRIAKLPTYLFVELDKKKEEVLKKGVDVIDLGVGDPDIPTPSVIVEEMKKRVEDPANHIYPSYSGMDDFRKEAAVWFYERFGVELDYKDEIITLIGSKEGIFHLPLAFIDPGDVVLVPDPGYPVYRASTIFSGGFPYPMPLVEDRNFLPDFSSIPSSVLERAKIVFLNYPNNPTSVPCSLEFFEEVLFYAKKFNFIVAHDAAYSEIYFDGNAPHSILELRGAKDYAIEFHSLSKTFSMTGWRIGFAVGGRDIVSALGKVKTNVDSGVFNAIQWAGVKALKSYRDIAEKHRMIYGKRRKMVEKALVEAGFYVVKSNATFYLWVKVPEGNSMDFASRLLEEKGILVTPGIGFGEFGEGFFRISLTVPDSQLEEAVRRIAG